MAGERDRRLRKSSQQPLKMGCCAVGIAGLIVLMDAAGSYATQVIDQGSTLAYDYLLLDSLLARTGDTAASIALLKKGISISRYEQSFYANLAVRQLSNEDAAEGVATI